MKHVRIHITGIVQGVGMRPFVYREAVAHGVTGWVLNAGDGVHVEAHGEADAIDAFVRALREEAPAAASIADITMTPIGEKAFDAKNLAGFRIIASEDDTEHTTLVSPDIATCPDCLRELFDPADRRYHYPFINCTNCGPRFTIIRSLPYDRTATSMDAFPICPDCAREYADPLDRRFHAQPDACFECGPHLTWREAGENATMVGRTPVESDTIIARCAELLAAGGIVAIKGLGGFHLACDAGNDEAVRELRRRKRRSNKPLAVMARTLEEAEALCKVDETEYELLTGTVRPIVLLKRRATGSNDAPRLAPSVAFNLPELGIMLPYTPLQHLLLAACAEHGLHALVMTSGNISEEPIEIDDALAWKHLVESGIADALLGNDRAILARYDDSVVRVVDGEVQMVRRARGYAPRPLALPSVAGKTAIPSILACGSEQKATLALTRELPDGVASCFLSQHIGDMENGATFDAWHAARTRFERLFDLRPSALTCDLHPSYLPSQWAREQTRVTGLPFIEIQHHHAHIASVIAEAAARGKHNPEQPVIGIAFDGTGAGAQAATGSDVLEPDGTIWGGEFLIADLTGFTRAAHLKPWRLPGGAASVRDPRRNAFSLLHAYNLLDHPGANPLLASLTAEERTITTTMVERSLNSPLTSSMGRFLDAVAAILGICEHATYEGEPAILLEAAAHRATATKSLLPADNLAVFDRYERFSAEDSLSCVGSCGTQPAKQQDCFERLVQKSNAGDCQATGMSVKSFISVKNRHNASPNYEKDGATAKKSRVPDLEIDLRPLLNRIFDGIAADEPVEALALLTHATIAHMAVDVAADLAAKTGIRTVALSGGVFMNRLLLSDIRHGLEQRDLTALLPHDVPVNDGCIAYGQAAITRAKMTHLGSNPK